MTLPALTGPEAFTQALADIQGTAAATHEVFADLEKLLRPGQRAAGLRTVKLTQTRPESDEPASRTAKSFTVLNPYDIEIRLGIGAISPGNIAAVIVPPKSYMTVPSSAEDLAIAAAAADLAAGDAYVFVWLYDAPQPFAFGAWQ